MPDYRLTAQQRETMSAVSMIKKGGLTVDERLWTPAHMKLLRRAASYPEVERIFVHPGIKKKLCETATGDRSWLAKIRPFWGHDYHFHIRIHCPSDSPDCKSQQAVPVGDGCGKDLDWWFTDAVLHPKPEPPPTTPSKPKPQVTLNDLPPACRQVLHAP